MQLEVKLQKTARITYFQANKEERKYHLKKLKGGQKAKSQQRMIFMNVKMQHGTSS